LVLHTTSSVLAAYVLLAIIVFLSIYALARGLGTSVAVALASGWLMVAAVLPLGNGPVPMIEIASLIHPSSTYVIAMFCMVAALFLHVGRYDLRWNVGMAGDFLSSSSRPGSTTSPHGAGFAYMAAALAIFT